MRTRQPFVALALSACAIAGGWVATGAIATASTTHHHHPAPKKKVLQLAGDWKGSYSGGRFSGTFKVTWKQSGNNLTGNIYLSNPAGNYTCNGSVTGSSIQFGAVGVGATYTGSVGSDGKSMSGSWKSPVDHGSWSGTKS